VIKVGQTTLKWIFMKFLAATHTVLSF